MSTEEEAKNYRRYAEALRTGTATRGPRSAGERRAETEHFIGEAMSNAQGSPIDAWFFWIILIAIAVIGAVVGLSDLFGAQRFIHPAVTWGREVYLVVLGEPGRFVRFLYERLLAVPFLESPTQARLFSLGLLIAGGVAFLVLLRVLHRLTRGWTTTALGLVLVGPLVVTFVWWGAALGMGYILPKNGDAAASVPPFEFHGASVNSATFGDIKALLRAQGLTPAVRSPSWLEVESSPLFPDEPLTSISYTFWGTTDAAPLALVEIKRRSPKGSDALFAELVRHHRGLHSLRIRTDNFAEFSAPGVLIRVINRPEGYVAHSAQSYVPGE